MANLGPVRASVVGTLLVLAWPLFMTLGAASMLTLLLPAEEVVGASVGGDSMEGSWLGDIGGMGLVFNVCTVGVDAAFCGDTGRWIAEAARIVAELLVGRAGAILELVDTLEAGPEVGRIGLGAPKSGVPLA